MITFKCKMCGGDLTFEPGASVAECPYCGTNQTLPKLDDDKRANLYDRANHFRRQNEYDKATAIYEQVLAEDRTDAEAYWSLVLCRYGIEYVEDPTSHKRVPTVNRVQYASILADEDYKSALQYADTAQRSVYEAEANAIAEIQKGILDISRKEAPFDVFICYKETDANGRRTPDSVLANDMYHQLTKEGFKVFFSRITLEDKIGTAYEPYIFAALNSAKVMVVLGTKPEYFNAVWVKNEWSRYLALIRGGTDKTLVPAYRDMDPYDLPDEFAHLQAQDMGKLGFMQDLIRGIKKILHKDEPRLQTVVQPTAATPVNNVAPLLKRAFMFLEDGDFARADVFCEQVLNLDPENGRAYLGKLMVDLQVRRESDLKNQPRPFDGESNYQKIMRFGDEALKKQVQEDAEIIYCREKFNRATELLENADSIEQCATAKTIFESIRDFEGVSEKLPECEQKTNAIKQKGNIIDEVERKVATLKERASIAKEKYENQMKVYISAEGKLKEARQALKEAQMRYEQSKDTLSNAQSEMQNLRGLFTGKRRRELEAIIEESEAKMKSGEIQIQESRILYDDLLAMMPQKPIPLDINDEYELIYRCAELYREAQLFDMAWQEYDKILEYKDALLQGRECGYRKAVSAQRNGKLLEALAIYRKIGKDYKDVALKLVALERRVASYAEKISTGTAHTVGLKSDGTVVSVGLNYHGQCDVGDLRNIVAVSAGGQYTICLREDGTVVELGWNDKGKLNVNDWKHIKSIAAGYNFAAGIKTDGIVAVTGECLENDGTVVLAEEWLSRHFRINKWLNTISISAGMDHMVGLKEDGTVVAVETWSNDNGQCNVNEWRDIVAVSAGAWYTVGLKKDGSVIAVGENNKGQCNVEKWQDIVAISAGGWHTVGLKKDGTVVAVGDNAEGQCDVNSWKDIIAVSAKESHTVGLKRDGTVIAVGQNTYGQCNVGDWKLWD